MSENSKAGFDLNKAAQILALLSASFPAIADIIMKLANILQKPDPLPPLKTGAKPVACEATAAYTQAAIDAQLEALAILIRAHTACCPCDTDVPV